MVERAGGEGDLDRSESDAAGLESDERVVATGEVGTELRPLEFPRCAGVILAGSVLGSFSLSQGSRRRLACRLFCSQRHGFLPLCQILDIQSISHHIVLALVLMLDRFPSPRRRMPILAW